MVISGSTRDLVKKEIVSILSGFPEVRKIVLFGSFVTSDTPQDIDIAIFQDSNEGYYPLARKYRRNLRDLARKIPLDIIPVRPNLQNDPFLKEIEKGEVVYEG